jgi:IMP dehydrogenase/GMP reductase
MTMSFWQPAYSEVLPAEIPMSSTVLARKNQPECAGYFFAAMDTVTEDKMAIALALEGRRRCDSSKS